MAGVGIDQSVASLLEEIEEVREQFQGGVTILSALEKHAEEFARAVDLRGRSIMAVVQKESVTREELEQLKEWGTIQGEGAQTFVLYAKGVKQTFDCLVRKASDLIPRVNKLLQDSPERQKYLN